MLIFLTCLFARVSADLPIHCELSDIQGTWSFQMTRVGAPKFPLNLTRGLPDFCGAQIGRPTKNHHLLQSTFNPTITTAPMTVFLTGTQDVKPIGPVSNETRHMLLAYNANDSRETGFWTTTFDQGFEARIGNKSFLAFSKYSCGPNVNSYPTAQCLYDDDAHEQSDGSVPGWVSDCSSTFFGWFHETDESGEIQSLGCFQGDRLGDAPGKKLVHLSLAQTKGNLRSRGQVLSTDPVEDSQPTACNIDKGIEFPLQDTLPINWDWRDQLTSFNWNVPITEQGSCGSCYAVAATYALQARANILLAKAGINNTMADLSIQSIVSCSWYNQGCQGGLEILVHRHSQELGVPSSSCMPYTSGFSGNDGDCKSSCFSDESQLWFAKDYGYVGGFIGLCSEERIKRNLFENGPLTVAVNVKQAKIGKLDFAPPTQKSTLDSDIIGVKVEAAIPSMSSIMVALVGDSNLRPFVSSTSPQVSTDNKSGVIYISARAVNRNWQKFQTAFNAALKNNNYQKTVKIIDSFSVGIHGWEYIDHSIVVVGWGEDKDELGEVTPYWIIRNSWNAAMENGGYTKIRRGADTGAIESAAVWVTPDPCRGALRRILKENDKLPEFC